MFNYFQGYNLNFSSSIFSFYMDWFHSFNCSLLLGVLIFVSLLFLFLIFNNIFFKSSKIEYQFGELLCSLFPTLILLFQMVPSLSLLYYYGLMNIDSNFTVKVIGHQWYWSYDYSDFENLEFDSYMKSVDSLLVSEFRLLDVDNRCVVPVEVNIRFCITSADVIQAWTLSSLSFKLDAMSGILSILNYNFPLIGVFYGQCSEICGANHSFMPIVVEVTLFELFKSWCMLV
uniref:Cytochrome c oxidase subunit 2 n=1 Tax=Bursaphelenchus xylophilus TaxID=6326 RepID=M1E1R2_BURXY|nr:cytochrome c oxidase subunit II [Bursaphelenchus xylophilus]ACV96733.1 cytochrome c oxidase subunit II [Bursaphelenchus xylophilus]